MPKLSDEEWAKAHKAMAREFLQSELVRVINTHIRLTHMPGHLTAQEIAMEFIAAIGVIQHMEKENEEARRPR